MARQQIQAGDSTARSKSIELPPRTTYAAKELGDKFDLRQFRDQVLGHGALPLDIPERRIKEGVARKKK